MYVLLNYFHTKSYNCCRLAKQNNVVQGFTQSKLGLPVLRPKTRLSFRDYEN